MKIIRVDYDRDSENPSDWDQWKLVSFNRRHASFKHPDTFFPPDIGLRRKIETGTAFVLSYYEHGSCVWSLANEGPQCRWDTARVAGILIWEGPPADIGADFATRQRNARGFLSCYTSWCNGEVYGYTVEREVTLPCGHTDIEDVDSCWGFYGADALADAIREHVEPGESYRLEGEAVGLLHGVDLHPAPAPTAAPSCEVNP